MVPEFGLFRYPALVIVCPRGVNTAVAMDPQGKVAVVTGGADGIGLAFVKELLRNGASVVVCDINVEVAKQAMKEITETFGKDRALFIQMDVRSESDYEGALNAAKSHFKRLDIVVNNAGVFGETEWEKTIEVNVKGVLRGTILALKHMGKDNGGEGGVIVNTASIAGLDYYPTQPAYTTTKHAVVAMTRCYGMPFHYKQTGVRVLAICPGATKTKLLANFHTGLPKQSWVDETLELISTLNVIEPEDVADSFMQMIREAESGSVWVSEGQETFTVNLPSYTSLLEKREAST